MNDSSNEIISDSDMPSLFTCASTASANAQRTYLLLLAFGLILQVAGVAVSLYQPATPDNKWIVPAAAALFFGVSLILTIILKTRQYEKIWYGGRAAAESVKTGTWRYATCSDPYSCGLSEQIVDGTFVKNLRAILEERKYLSYAIGAEFPSGQQITDKMRAIRKLTINKRLQVYMDQRIGNQRDWYARKAKENQKAVNNLFWLFIIAQGLTLVFALIRIKWPDLINLTGIFAVIGASILAWLQIKKHQELAQSYAVTAHELGFVVERGRHVKTDSDLANFVADAETAISREHTLWVARRESA